jgi:hypothetical protein
VLQASSPAAAASEIWLRARHPGATSSAEPSQGFSFNEPVSDVELAPGGVTETLRVSFRACLALRSLVRAFLESRSLSVSADVVAVLVEATRAVLPSFSLT